LLECNCNYSLSLAMQAAPQDVDVDIDIDKEGERGDATVTLSPSSSRSCPPLIGPAGEGLSVSMLGRQHSERGTHRPAETAHARWTVRCSAVTRFKSTGIASARRNTMGSSIGARPPSLSLTFKQRVLPFSWLSVGTSFLRWRIVRTHIEAREKKEKGASR
jgi:hypothetical protein